MSARLLLEVILPGIASHISFLGGDIVDQRRTQLALALEMPLCLKRIRLSVFRQAFFATSALLMPTGATGNATPAMKGLGAFAMTA